MSPLPGADAMRGLYWWGPASFFACPVVDDPAGADIGLIGVPHSTGNLSTDRDQHLAPRAVREVSAYYRRMHTAFGFDPWEEQRINDLGDAPLPHMNNGDLASGDIERAFEAIAAAGTRPVAMGGDHTITLPILRALTGDASSLSKGVSMIVFDAHLDTYELEDHDWWGIKNWAGNWAALVAREGCVDASRSVQVGRRGHFSKFAANNVPDLGYQRIDMDEYEQIGVEQTLARIRETVGENPVYVTFDMDVFDVSVAPAVAAPEAGEEGFRIRDAVGLLRGLRGLNVIGADIVCFNPLKDGPSRTTSLVASAIMFEQICLIADALRTA